MDLPESDARASSRSFFLFLFCAPDSCCLFEAIFEQLAYTIVTFFEQLNISLIACFVIYMPKRCLIFLYWNNIGIIIIITMMIFQLPIFLGAPSGRARYGSGGTILVLVEGSHERHESLNGMSYLPPSTRPRDYVPLFAHLLRPAGGDRAIVSSRVSSYIHTAFPPARNLLKCR